jgi:RNA polymerase sigma-70 factor, ECF subfamily
VNLAAQRRPADFLAIYNAQGAYVRRTLQRMGVPDRHLDDAMQDVFVVVLRRLPEYQDVNRLTGWLAAIAHNVAAKRCEQEVARPIVADPATVERLFDPEHPETAIGKRDLARWLLAQIKSPARRTVYIMHHGEDLTLPEVAGALGIPLGTAKTRLHDAEEEVDAALQRLRAREQRSGVVAASPALATLWLVERPIPPLPEDVADRVWAALQQTPAWRAAHGGRRFDDGAARIARRAAPLAAAFVAGLAVGALWRPVREAPPIEARPEPVTAVALSAVPALPSPSPSSPPPPEAPGPSRSSAPPSAAPIDSVTERAVIDRASMMLAAGDTSGALRAVEEHVRAFPGGALVEKRERTRIEALIRAGRTAEARQHLTSFALRYPRSSALDALRRAVDAPGP